MTRKKRDDSNPQASEGPTERPQQGAGAESPFAAQAAPPIGADKPAEDQPAAEQDAEPGGPIAPTPATQQAETAAAPEIPPAAEPVAATPETQRAEPDMAAPAPAEPAAQPAVDEPRRRGVSAGGAFALGLLASLLITALAGAGLWSQRERVAQLLGPGDERIGAIEGRAAQTSQRIEQLAAQLGALDGSVASLRETVAGLRQQVPAGSGVDAGRLDQLGQRLQALEGAQANRVDPAQVAALDQGLQRLAREVAQVQESVAGLSKSAADAATVLRLTDRIEAAEGAVRQAQSRVNAAQNLLLAVGQLREAVNRGEGFDAELRAVGAIAGNDAPLVQPLQALQPLAANGAPTRAVLTDRFDDLAGRIVRADFGPDEEGWWRQTVQRLASVVTVRRTEGEVAGDSVAAVVARAEAALKNGDLAGAVQQLKALQGPAARTAAPWLQEAQARLAAEKALSDLTAHAVAQTKAGG
jgi:hypothetical protein